METLTEDLWMMVLSKLPIKIFTGLKLVCKQWKSVLESPFFRDVFLSLRQNPRSSSWSLMSTLEEDPEIVSHYQCDTWGLDRSLGSFIESFLADKQQKHKDQQVSVEAYSDVGLILIHVESTNTEKGVIYVANPVSRECVEIFHDALPIGFETNESSWDWGLVARTENGHLLDYKVVILEKYKWCFEMLSCLIYSSETGLWSLETLHIPHSCLILYPGYPISLNGNLHWFGRSTDRHRVLLSMDIYTTSIMGSLPCRVTPFPDIEKTTKFARACTPCQGFLMYMNIVSVTKVDGSQDNKLCVWRLMSEGWQLMSEISADFILNGGFDYLPVTINPFDAKTAYFWSKEGQRLVSINLHNGELMIHNNQLDGRSDSPIIIPVKDPRAMISLESTSYMEYINTANLDPFILPQWLHRIPVSIKQPTTTDQEHESKDIPSKKIVHGKAVTTAIRTDGASAIEL